MSGKAGTKRGLVAAGATVLVVVGLLAAFAGATAAAPVTPSASATASWAYGGQNSTNGSRVDGIYTITWSASVGDVVIFNATPTGPNVTELQAQRTVGVTIMISISDTKGSATFNYHATEVVNAYANITNASTVDVAGKMVPALGVENSAFHGTASLAESLVDAGLIGSSASAYLNVSAKANAQVSFAPALGVIPLKLAGVTEWNSTAMATPSAAWNISWNYAIHGWNNTTAVGGSARSGSWDASGPVNLTGQLFTVGLPHFHDLVPRVGVLLTVRGPARLYDGFIFIPRGFDLFSATHQAYDSDSMSNVTISGQALYLTTGRVKADSLTASKLTVGGGSGKVPLLVAPKGSEVPAAASSVGGSVVAQPESVSAAQSQAHCLQFGCASAAPWFSGAVALVIVGGLIAAVAGTVGVVEWRSYARRKNRSNQLIGGYGEAKAFGAPPSAGPNPTAPPAPMSGTEETIGSGRQN